MQPRAFSKGMQSVRSCHRGLSSAQKGIVGELLGAQTVKNVLPEAVQIGRIGEIGSRGIDDLYRVSSPNADYLIVEYKFGTSLLRRTADGVQMSDSWVLGSDRIVKALENNLVEADLVRKAVEAGRLEKWVVHTDPAGGTTVWMVNSSGGIVKAGSDIESRILGGKR